MKQGSITCFHQPGHMLLEDPVDENAIYRFEKEKIEIKDACHPSSDSIRSHISRVGQDISQYEAPIRKKNCCCQGTAILAVVKMPNDEINQPYCSIAAMAIQCAASLFTRTCRTRSANGPPPGMINNGRFDALRIGTRLGIRVYRLPPTFTINEEVD